MIFYLLILYHKGEDMVSKLSDRDITGEIGIYETYRFELLFFDRTVITG